MTWRSVELLDIAAGSLAQQLLAAVSSVPDVRA
jgi:hypothetical protein